MTVVNGAIEKNNRRSISMKAKKMLLSGLSLVLAVSVFAGCNKNGNDEKETEKLDSQN